MATNKVSSKAQKPTTRRANFSMRLDMAHFLHTTMQDGEIYPEIMPDIIEKFARVIPEVGKKMPAIRKYSNAVISAQKELRRIAVELRGPAAAFYKRACAADGTTPEEYEAYCDSIPVPDVLA
jgi:hypothetical protein